MIRLRSADVEQAMLAAPGPPGVSPRAASAAQRTLMQARSYLLMRRTVGYAGAILPTVLILVEVLLLEGGFKVRGSLSAYYHSGARDFFVATLCIVGLTLITYLGTQRATWQYLLSLVAGVAAFVVALVPTRLPAGTPDALLTPVQQRLGEDAAYAVHLTAAAVFIVALGVLCFVTAESERGLARAGLTTSEQLLATVRIHRACGVAIFAAVGWVLVGIELGPFTPLYVGEVVAVYAFALSWIRTARDLAALLERRGL